MPDLNAPALTEQQLTAFERDGFLAIDRLVDPADLQEIEAEYEQLLDRLADELFAQGSITDRFASLSFGDRYSRIIAEYPELHRFFNVSLPLLNDDDPLASSASSLPSSRQPAPDTITPVPSTPTSTC